MGEFGLVAVAAISALAGAGAVLLRQGRAAHAPGVVAATDFDADLKVQLTRARAIPGAEPLLDRLSQQPIIFTRELLDFAAQLDNLERKAKVDAARKDAFMARMAPVTARYAQEAMAAMSERRRAGAIEP